MRESTVNENMAPFWLALSQGFANMVVGRDSAERSEVAASTTPIGMVGFDGGNCRVAEHVSIARAFYRAMQAAGMKPLSNFVRLTFWK
jgi:hypothetical protein